MAFKRFLVFECESYYPAGGIDDLKAAFDTEHEALAYCQERLLDLIRNRCWFSRWYDVFDIIEGVSFYVSVVMKGPDNTEIKVDAKQKATLGDNNEISWTVIDGKPA